MTGERVRRPTGTERHAQRQRGLDGVAGHPFDQREIHGWGSPWGHRPHIEDDAANVRPFDEETSEVLDESILETHRNRPVEAAFGELQYRERVLGEAYPFAVDTHRLGLARVADVTAVPGRSVYLFCLLASAMRENRIQPPGLIRAATSEIANMFQVCACLAAGGYTAGEVVWAHSRFPGHALTPTGVMAIRCKQFHLPDL